MGFLDKIFGKKQPDSPQRGFEGVRSGSSSTLRKESAPAPSTPAPTAASRTYEVKSGDSLSKIAKQFYGDANQWRKIYEANRSEIKNPDLIYPGQKIVIP